MFAAAAGITTKTMLSFSEYRAAKKVGIYLSMPFGELSTTSLVQNALADGKEVYVPYLHGIIGSSSQPSASVMDMLALRSFEEFQSLEPDRWGIPSLKPSQVVGRKSCLGGYGPVPGLTCESTVDTSLYGVDLIIMPGMAFDHGFRRLGHGKGYYDDFLARYLDKGESGKMPFLGKRCSSPTRTQSIAFDTCPSRPLSPRANASSDRADPSGYRA